MWEMSWVLYHVKQHPWILCLLDARNIPFQCGNQKRLQILPNVPGVEKLPRFENHWLLKIILQAIHKSRIFEPQLIQDYTERSANFFHILIFL